MAGIDRGEPPSHRAGWLRGVIAVAALGLVLVACRSPQPPAPPPPAAPEPRVVAPAPAEAPRRFCPALARIVDAERHGFAALRSQRLDGELWSGREQPEGLVGCRIEGGYWPAAIYQCRHETPPAREARSLERGFEAFAAEIDACLAGPEMAARQWQRGRPMALARGERFLQWHDNATLPRPILVLKIEEDIARRRFELLLRVSTFR
jgi:hypothetical protein